MTQRTAPSLAKWPFLVGDLFLLATAWWIVNRSPDPFQFWPLLFLVGCVAAGAWLSVIPFLADHRAALKLAEADTLASVTSQINELETIGRQVSGATGQWMDIHDKATQAAEAVREVAERMSVETKAFGEFMEKANETEKAHLRLEVEKLRRGEADWVKVVVVMLDHVYALHRAAVQSGKAGLIQQLTHFQRACRESARHVGLIPLEVAAGEVFQPETHVLPESEANVPEDAQVAEMLATGYTFQGRLVRKPLVRLAAGAAGSASNGLEPAGAASGGTSDLQSPEEPESLR